MGGRKEGGRVRGCGLPFHDDHQAAMAHEDILVNILEINDVGMVASPPVEVDLTTRLGHVTQYLG